MNNFQKIFKPNLATIEVVEDLYIVYDKENKPAENIEGLKLVELGYPIKVQKGLHSVGSKVVYIKWDSCLSENELFDTFIKSGKLGTHNRVKIIKLLGSASCGIVLSLDTVLSYLYNNKLIYSYFVYPNDLTELLGIHKIEEVPNNLDAKGNIPSFLYKTDEDNINNNIEILNNDNRYVKVSYEQLINEIANNGEEIQITEKKDGSSESIYVKIIDNELTYGITSRGVELKLDCENTYISTAKNIGLPNKLLEFCKKHNLELALRGELIGGLYKTTKTILIPAKINH